MKLTGTFPQLEDAAAEIVCLESECDEETMCEDGGGPQREALLLALDRQHLGQLFGDSVQVESEELLLLPLQDDLLVHGGHQPDQVELPL